MHSLITFIAKDFLLIPVIVVIYWLWKQNDKDRKHFLALLVLGGVLSLILAKIGSHFYTDPRPVFKDHIQPYFPASDYNGFPSDHTLLAAFLGFAVLKYWRQAGYGLLVLAAVIGWARVAAGVHHLVDIIGSFVFAALATFITIRLLEFWQTKQTVRKSG